MVIKTNAGVISGYFLLTYDRVSGNSSSIGDNSTHAIPIITTRAPYAGFGAVGR